MNLLETAREAASAIQQDAESIPLPATVCVIDANGLLVFEERMEGAGPLTLEMAELKAHTAAVVGMATADLTELVQPGQPLFGLTSAGGGKFVAFGGGVPLHDDAGSLVGGLGVSAGTIEDDTRLANLALEAISK